MGPDCQGSGGGAAGRGRIGAQTEGTITAMLSLLSLATGLLVGPTVAPLRAVAQQQQQRAGSSAIMSTRGVVITGGAAGVGYAYADEVCDLFFA